MTAKLTTRSPWWEYLPVVKTREPFKTYGSFYAEVGLYGKTLGRLAPEWHSSVGQANYVIYSYATPIAWFSVDEGWVFPDERYSVTTSRHQGKIFFIKDWL